MIRIIVTQLILCISIFTYSQPFFHGTYIISGICKDGIIIFADSRSVFKDTDGKIGAYFEGFSKIYQFNNILLSVGGAVTFKKIYFEQLAIGFKDSVKTTQSPTIFLDRFLKYCKSKMATSDYKVLLNNQFMVCAYNQNVPTILWRYKSERENYNKIGQYKSNNESDKNNPQLERIFETKGVYEVLPTLSYSLGMFTKNANKDTVSSFGGKLSIAIIQNKNINWISQQDEKNFASKKEFMKAYKAGFIKMWYRSPKDSIELRQLLLREENQ